MEKTNLRAGRDADAVSPKAPAEVTPAMIEAGLKQLNTYEAEAWYPTKYEAVSAIYRAMRLLDRA